jgi:hypothetical protein
MQSRKLINKELKYLFAAKNLNLNAQTKWSLDESIQISHFFSTWSKLRLLLTLCTVAISPSLSAFGWRAAPLHVWLLYRFRERSHSILRLVGG